MSRSALVFLSALLLIVVALPLGAGEAKVLPVSTSSPAALNAYEQGLDLFENIHFPDARAQFEKALSMDPSFCMAQTLLSMTLPTPKARFDSLATAEKICTKATEGERAFVRAIRTYFDGDPEGSIAKIQMLSKQYPEDLHLRWRIASSYLNRDHYDEAIMACKEAIAIRTNAAPFYNFLGYAHAYKGEYDQAVEALRTYAELRPKDANPRDSLGEVLLKAGRYDESAKAYAKAASLNPNFHYSFWGLGHSHLFAGNDEAARDSYSRAYDAATTDEAKLQSLGWSAISWVHSGVPTRAAKKLGQVSHKAEKMGHPEIALGYLMDEARIEAAIGETDTAIATLKKAEKLLQSSGLPKTVAGEMERGLLYTKGIVYVQKGDEAAAIRIADTLAEQVAAQADPREEQWVCALKGRIALREKDWSTAREELGKANQENPEILNFLAKAYDGAGDQAMASMLRKKAMDWNQNSLSYALVRYETSAARAAGGSPY